MKKQTLEPNPLQLLWYYELESKVLLPESYGSHITSIAFDAKQLRGERITVGINADVDPPMPVALMETIRDKLWGIAIDGGLVSRFIMFSEAQMHGVLWADYIVKDGEWVREESFSPYEDVDDT